MMCRTGNGEEGRCVRRDVTHGRAAPLSIPAASDGRTAARYEQTANEQQRGMNKQPASEQAASEQRACSER